MTCIVGIKEEGKVFLGGDSASTDGYRTNIIQQKKVFKRNGMVIGGACSARQVQLVQYVMNIPPMGLLEDEHEYLITSFVDNLRECLKTYEDSETGDVTLLVGLRGRLFTIYENFYVMETVGDFHAIGAGSDYALGALSILKDSEHLTAKQKLKRALEVSNHFCNVVNPPFQFVEE